MRKDSIFHALCFLVFVFLVILPSSLQAKLTGVCSNCHTMHNSQGGQPMTFNLSLTPEPCLLRGNCIGCHGQQPSGSYNIIPLGNVPQVLHLAATDLAGGNFKYVSVATDNTGHNIFSTNVDGALDNNPPGYNSSYDESTVDWSTLYQITCASSNGCHGDRNVNRASYTDGSEASFAAIKGAHHTDDGVLKFGSIVEANQGGTVGTSYRFLKGVKGGEDTDWQNTSSTSEHNEYRGATTKGTLASTYTISALCRQCHGNYHEAIGTASPWLRHPTDISLPATGEYTACTTYNLTAPVARTSGWSGWTTGGGSPSGTVTPSGTTDDIVMCLSCHRAHGSPYFKILRWDYKSTTLSTALSGCNVCHTSKN